MTTVRLYEPRVDHELLPRQRTINRRLRARGLSVRVRLWRSGKDVGYTIPKVPASMTRQDLEYVRRTVLEVLDRSSDRRG